MRFSGTSNPRDTHVLLKQWELDEFNITARNTPSALTRRIAIRLEQLDCEGTCDLSTPFQEYNRNKTRKNREIFKLFVGRVEAWKPNSTKNKSFVRQCSARVASYVRISYFISLSLDGIFGW